MSVTIRNVSPLGALDIPALGLVIDADAIFTVPDDVAAALLEQPSNFVAVQDIPASDEDEN